MFKCYFYILNISDNTNVGFMLSQEVGQLRPMMHLWLVMERKKVKAIGL